MRSDMKDIIVNSPRVSGGRYKVPRFDVDDENTHQSRMRMFYPNTDPKEMTNRLQVVRRYLHSKIGWKWDDIWADVCCVNNINNFRAQHLRGHVPEFVYKVTNYVTVCLDGRDTFPNSDPVVPDFYYANFYLDTENRLRCTPNKPRLRHRHSYQDMIIDFQGKSYYKHNGIWYEVETETMTTVKVSVFMDISDAFGLCHRTCWPLNEVQHRYGKDRYPISKRQVNSRTAKKLRQHLVPKAKAS